MRGGRWLGGSFKVTLLSLPASLVNFCPFCLTLRREEARCLTGRRPWSPGKRKALGAPDIYSSANTECLLHARHRDPRRRERGGQPLPAHSTAGRQTGPKPSHTVETCVPSRVTKGFGLAPLGISGSEPHLGLGREAASDLAEGFEEAGVGAERPQDPPWENAGKKCAGVTGWLQGGKAARILAAALRKETRPPPQEGRGGRSVRMGRMGSRSHSPEVASGREGTPVPGPGPRFGLLCCLKLRGGSGSPGCLCSRSHTPVPGHVAPLRPGLGEWCDS